MSESATNAVPSAKVSNRSRLVTAQEGVCVHVRLTTRHQARHLNDIQKAEFIDRAVKKIFPMLGIPVHSYCLLPDKLHLILKCDDPQKLHSAVYRFSKTTGLIALRRFRIHLWQWKYSKSFLVTDEEINKTSKKIMELPQALGLMGEKDHYPFRGCISVNF